LAVRRLKRAQMRRTNSTVVGPQAIAHHDGYQRVHADLLVGDCGCGDDLVGHRVAPQMVNHGCDAAADREQRPEPYRNGHLPRGESVEPRPHAGEPSLETQSIGHASRQNLAAMRVRIAQTGQQ
jgi:hypothetical protein